MEERMQQVRNVVLIVISLALGISIRAQSVSLLPTAPVPSTGASTAAQPAANISGTVNDDAGDVIPGATVTLLGPGSASSRTVTAGESGGFSFDQVPPGGPYRITVHATGFADWTSADLELQPEERQTAPAGVPDRPKSSRQSPSRAQLCDTDHRAAPDRS